MFYPRLLLPESSPANIINIDGLCGVKSRLYLSVLLNLVCNGLNKHSKLKATILSVGYDLLSLVTILEFMQMFFSGASGAANLPESI